MSFITRLIVLVLVGCSLATGTASAGEGFGGIVYVEKEREVPSGERTSLSVFCPGGLPVISGGIHITGTDLSIEVASTAPVDGRRDADKIPDDGWRAAANNDSGESETMTVRAQCGSKSARKSLRYVSTKRVIEVFQEAEAIAICPDAFVVIGGGVSTTGTSTSVTLVADHPYDIAGDANPERDNGWKVRVANRSEEPVTIKTTAVCVKTDVGTWSYPESQTGIAPGEQESHSVLCPGGDIGLGGGAIAEADVNLASIEMVENPDLGGATKGWLAWFNNPSTWDIPVKVIAICVD